MAKSTRSKVKRAYRAKKREAGVYAAAEAARLNRLNAKLAQIVAGSEEDMPVPLDNSGGDDDIPAGHAFICEGDPLQPPYSKHYAAMTRFPSSPGLSEQRVRPPPSDKAPIDAENTSRISTHGFRNSRREEWRRSKGMPVRTGKGTNRRGASMQRKAAHGKRR